jgi:hypothetical protein
MGRFHVLFLRLLSRPRWHHCLLLSLLFLRDQVRDHVEKQTEQTQRRHRGRDAMALPPNSSLCLVIVYVIAQEKQRKQ